MKRNQPGRSFDSTLKNYIDMHPAVMAAILEKDNQNCLKVSYANDSLKQFFLSENGQYAEEFFGDFWSVVKGECRLLHENEIRTKEILWRKNNHKILLQANFQKNFNEDREYLIVELRKQCELLTERQKRMEVEQKYSSILNNNLDSIISVNKNLEIIRANLSAQKFFRGNRHELIGSSWLYLIVESDREKMKKLIAKSFAGEQTELVNIKLNPVIGVGSNILTAWKIVPVFVKGEVTEVHIVIRDLSIEQKNNEQLIFLSYHDQLTGLWNRRALRENFEKVSSGLERHNQLLSVIHLGLDRFKLISDSLGREGAEDILKRVSERLKYNCSDSSQLYRYGEDEFILTIKNYDIGKTEKLVKKLLDEFAKPFYYKHQEYFISVSIGISMYPIDGTDLDELIRKSEQALTYVKEQGRSHYRFYEGEMDAVFLEEAMMEAHLRRAIELDELKVYYQPQVNLRTGHISSFEALLRWNNGKFGFVSPGQFIPLAEKTGLIHWIGDWVLDNVCKQLKEWQDKRYRNVRIAINISPKQFKTNDFAGKVKQKIEQYGILPSSLEVEITESALANMEDTLDTLNELKKIGVYISVDDFGTGYSSLSYLKSYPIDTIKIDRSFIKGIESDEKNKAIALMIINLAHNLGMDVIAEGVEKDLQAKILLDAKCQKAQGFLYSKAIPIDDIVARYLTN